jgi:hypothetical protein
VQDGKRLAAHLKLGARTRRAESVSRVVFTHFARPSTVSHTGVEPYFPTFYKQVMVSRDIPCRARL